MKYRLERIKKIIRNEIMILLSEKKIKDPRIPEFVTITRVTISKDLHYSHVYFTLLDENKNHKLVEKGLNSASGYIQKILAEKLAIRFIPKIEFRYDINEEKANKVDKLLDIISKSRQTIENQDSNIK